MNRKQLINSITSNLERIHNFDPNTIVRKDELGVLSFEDALPSMQIIVNSFKKIPISIVENLSNQKLNNLHSHLTELVSHIDSALKFDPTTGNPSQNKSNIMTPITNFAINIYDFTHDLISYSAASTTDFQELERKADVVLGNIDKKSDDIIGQLIEKSDEANNLLSELKKALHEQGVTQLSEHFKGAAEEYDKSAGRWRNITIGIALALLALSIVFISGWIPGPDNLYDAIQLAAGKLIAFSTLFYLLYMAGRNFLANNHNAVINRHRQNALLTHRAMVEAAGKQSDRDIVLSHAASCIYAPQPTGFTSGAGEQGSPVAKSVIEMLTRSGSSSGVDSM